MIRFGVLLTPKVAAGMAISVAIPAAIGLCLLLPQRRHATDLLATLAQEEDFYVEIMGQHSQDAALQRETGELRSELARIGSDIFGPNATPFHEQLESAAGKAGIVITSVEPTYVDSEEDKSLTQALVKVECKGDFHGIAMFVNHLENSGTFGLVSELKILADSETGSARGSLEVRTISRKRFPIRRFGVSLPSQSCETMKTSRFTDTSHALTGMSR